MYMRGVQIGLSHVGGLVIDVDWGLDLWAFRARGSGLCRQLYGDGRRTTEGLSWCVNCGPLCLLLVETVLGGEVSIPSKVQRLLASSSE